MGPRDFAPYRAQIGDCWCYFCREVAYAASAVDGMASDRHRAAAEALLGVLQAGQHTRVTLAERAAEAREEKAVRLAEAVAAGAPPGELAAIERGYVTVKMSDFYRTGMGLGIGPRHQD